MQVGRRQQLGESILTCEARATVYKKLTLLPAQKVFQGASATLFVASRDWQCL